MSVAEELDRLVRLRDSGVLDEHEFERAKDRVLNAKSAIGPREKLEPLPPPEARKKPMGTVPKIAIFAAAAMAAFLLFGAYEGTKPEVQERQRERAAIDLCWQEYERKSLDPVSKRFVAGACETMESDFRKKHGISP